MPPQQLFYRQVVPVNVERHKGWSVKTGDDHGFAAQVNSVPLAASEFAQATAEYPVVFATDGGAGAERPGAVFPVAILGLREGENLFVDAAGRWQARYLPAFVRRYPYAFARDQAGTTFTLTIDEAFEGCNQEGRGERLFDADGEQTAYLKSILAFLQDYQGRFLRTQAFGARLTELKLLQPMQADFTLPGGERRALTGFFVVDREKLKALPAEVVTDMLAKDELECLFLHMASLRNFQALLERAQPAAAPA